jgi:membrane protein
MTVLKKTSFFHFSVLHGLTWSQVRDLNRFAMRRLREERLPQVAGGLTFTTVLAMVPVLTIAFALFTTFPMFNSFRASLEAYFVQSLMPKAIANTILGYLTQFASKATRLSAIGAVALMITAVTMMSMIERVTNQIWRVRTARPLAQRIMVYWALVTLGPLLMGVSLSVSSHLFIATNGVVHSVPVLGYIFYTLVSIGLTTLACTLLYFAVPNRFVDWRDALWGGFLAAIAFEIAKRLFTIFVAKFSSYTMIYGALAAVPIFLLWVYVSWLITLVGAVLVASMPIVKYERWWHVTVPGGVFVDAMTILEVLHRRRDVGATAVVGTVTIRQYTRLGFDEIETLLEKMVEVGWVGRIKSSAPPTVQWGKRITEGTDHWVLLANPALLTLADVYRLFVFNVTSASGRMVPGNSGRGAPESRPGAVSALVEEVEQAVEQGLGKPLAEYFAQHPTAVAAEVPSALPSL